MAKFEYCLFGNNRAGLDAQLSKLDPTRRWKITAVEWKAQRSIEQNKLLWDYFTDFGAHVGYEGKQEIEDLKQMVTMKLHPKIVTNPITKNVVHLPPETSKMDTKEFSEMMDKIIRYTASLGFYRE